MRFIKTSPAVPACRPASGRSRFGSKTEPAGQNGSVGPLELSGGLITPNRPITITTSVSNVGPAPLTRTAELFVDGQAVPGMAQVGRPAPRGG